MQRIGANTWIWVSPSTDERLEVLIPQLAAWGFDVAEIAVEQPGQWDPAKTAALLKEHNLGATICAAMSADRDLTVTDGEVVAGTQAYLRACIDAAAEIGSGVVGGPMYAPVGRTWRLSPAEREETLTRLADALRPVAEYAEQAQVQLAVEPLNRFETSLINTTAQGLDLIDRVGSSSCGLLLDTFHMNIEEQDIPAALRAAGSSLAHFQVCANDRGAPGADHLDWQGIVAALRDVDYTLPICIESFTAENETIATAAAIWRPLAETQDALALDGLAFLRDLFST